MSATSLFTKLFRRTPKTIRTPKPAARLNVEGLENRLVPTTFFKPYFGAESTYDGGSYKLSSPPVFLLFSGWYWSNTAQGKADAAALTAAAGKVLTGPYLSGLTQYGVDAKASLGKQWFDDNGLATGFDDGDLDATVKRAIDYTGPGGGLPRPSTVQGWNNGNKPIYAVITPPGVKAENAAAAGYHQLTHYKVLLSAYEDMPEIWAGTSWKGGAVDVDDFTTTFSHEVVETITNPTANAWDGVLLPDLASRGIQVDPPGALPDAFKPDHARGEIADFEPEAASYKDAAGVSHSGYTAVVNGATVQAYWSRADQMYIIPDGSATRTVYAPQWNGTAVKAGSLTTPISVSSGLTVAPAAQELQINMAGTLWGNNGLPDNVSVLSNGNQLTVTINGQVFTYSTLSVSKVTITGSRDGDNVTLQNVKVPVTFAGGGGSDSLTLDDTVGTVLSNSTYAVTDKTITRTTVPAVGSPLTLTTVTYSGIGDVRLVLPATTNAVNVTALPTGGSPDKLTGQVVNRLTVKTTGTGPYAAHNAVTIDGTTFANGRGLDFQGGSADDQLTIRDNASTTVPYTLTANRIDTAFGIAPGYAGGTAFFTGLEGVNINSVDVLVGGLKKSYVGRQYTVASWPAATGLTLRGGSGSDSFTLGTAGLDALPGPVIDIAHPTHIAVEGYGGADLLTVSDSGTAHRAAFSVNQTSVIRSAAGMNDLRLAWADVETVNLAGGDGDDLFAVYGTPAAAQYRLFGNGGDDTANVGGTTLGNVLGGVTFDGGQGNDTVKVSDPFGPARTYTVAADSVKGWGATVQYSSTENVSLTTGDNPDRVSVTGTPAGTAVSISTRGGLDTVNLDLANLAGPLALDGGAGNNSLSVSDTNPSVSGFVITDTALSSDSKNVPAYYSNFTAVVLTGTDRPDNFYVDSTAAGARYTLRGRGGYDGYYFGYSTGTLDGIQGSVAVSDTAGQGLVRFEDVNNTDPHAYTLGAAAGSPLAFRRDGVADVDLSLYGDPSELAFLYLDTGSGADGVNVQALPAQFYSVNYLTEGDTVVVGSDPTGQNGDMRGIHGLLDVHSTAPVTVIADDSADPEARNVYVENGLSDPAYVDIVGMGAASMTFDVPVGSNVWLRGGRGDDTFRVVRNDAANPVSVDAGDGVDTLDYSWGDAYNVPFIGGVYVDLEGTTATGLNQAAGFENVVGSVGNDTIFGSDADDLILGMGGDDVLVGRGGNDVLIGGYGNDTLVGGEGDDLLIGGATAYDGYVYNYFGDDMLLNRVQHEWSRTDIGYAARIAHITGDAPGGLNGDILLTTGQVDDTDQADQLTGDEGSDWFLAPIGGVADLEDGERVG